MFVYKWPADKENDTGVVSEHSMCDVEGPGISSYRLNPPAAGTSLEHCLNQALRDVPREKHVGTPLYLGATAGMRLLNIADPQVSDAVLRAVAATLKTYPFDFRGAKILSGEEEGVFGWVTANYLLENFIKRGWLGEWIQPQKKTLGAMDFGGASTQITFETRDTIENPRNKVMLKLYGQAYKVYTHSFLCYGRDQVLKRLLSKLLQAESYQATVSHPCWPMGYNKSLLLSSIYDSPCTENERPSLALNTTVTLVGTGNGNLCALQVSKLFDFTNCSFSHCSFDGVFQPKVSGNFIAFSAFFYTVDFIQTVMGRPVHLPSDLKDAAETICATSWSEVGSLGTVGSRGLLHVGYHTGFERTHWVSWHQQIRGKAIYGSYTGLGGGSGGYGQPWPYRCNHPELQATSTRLAIAGLTHLLFLSVHPTQLLQKAPKLEKRLPDYCAVSTFVYLLTTKGYSFNNQSFPNIAFQKKAGETSIGWALGYMLNLTNMIPGEKPSFHKSMLYNYWIILILLFVVTTLTSLVTAICLLRYSKSSII
ncbi:ectonucleoside triphosphate diphosphohydrolase 2 isoform 2-T2 [Acridotheres tristis]